MSEADEAVVVATITVTRQIEDGAVVDAVTTEAMDGTALGQVDALGMLLHAVLDVYFKGEDE